MLSGRISYRNSRYSISHFTQLLSNVEQYIPRPKNTDFPCEKHLILYTWQSSHKVYVMLVKKATTGVHSGYSTQSGIYFMDVVVGDYQTSPRSAHQADVSPFRRRRFCLLSYRIISQLCSKIVSVPLLFRVTTVTLCWRTGTLQLKVCCISVIHPKSTSATL